jgi:hypothetical protein
MASNQVLKKLIVLFLFLFAFNNNSISQCQTINLIRNSGLEDHTCCPNNMGMIDCANYWIQPYTDGGTSDYFNICGIDSLLSQDMLPYWQHAHFGNGYGGIGVFAYNWSIPYPNDYREYIQGELSQPLVTGKCYYCQFWVKLFNYKNLYSYTAIDAISVYFSDTIPQKTPIDSMAMYFPSQINNQTGRIISDTLHWTMIADTFVAKGGEKYFTVGAFKKPNEINEIFYGQPDFSDAYYFFDNFSLCPCGDTMPDTTKPLKPVLEVYPNPAKDELFVLFDRYEQLNTIDLEVYNILGEMVMNRQVVSSPVRSDINIGQMASGCYVVVLKSEVRTLYKERVVVIR